MKTKRWQRGWARRPEVVEYVTAAYAGTESTEATHNAPRRVFLWETDSEVLMGNAQAFVEHLSQKFGFPLNKNSVSTLHKLLRGQGEQLKECPKRRFTFAQVHRPQQAEKVVIERKMNFRDVLADVVASTEVRLVPWTEEAAAFDRKATYARIASQMERLNAVVDLLRVNGMGVTQAIAELTEVAHATNNELTALYLRED